MKEGFEPDDTVYVLMRQLAFAIVERMNNTTYVNVEARVDQYEIEVTVKPGW